MTITIKGVPPSLNVFAGRNNTWEYRKAKQTWTIAVKLACMAHPERPKEPFEHSRVIIQYYFPDKRRRDCDNFAGKFLLDGLTKAGVIVDDDLKHLSVSVRGGYDRENPRTVIEIVEEKEN